MNQESVLELHSRKLENKMNNDNTKARINTLEAMCVALANRVKMIESKLTVLTAKVKTIESATASKENEKQNEP